MTQHSPSAKHTVGERCCPDLLQLAVAANAVDLISFGLDQLQPIIYDELMDHVLGVLKRICQWGCYMLPTHGVIKPHHGSKWQSPGQPCPLWAGYRRVYKRVNLTNARAQKQDQ